MESITITLRRIGNSLGFILPKEAAQMLNAEEGAQITITRSPDGIRMTAYDPEFEKKMRAADSLMARYKNSLKELAK